MNRPSIDTRWFDAPAAFAIERHRGQPRKGSDTPYIVHPLRVALILERHRFAPAVVVAGLLHDVVEDCGVGLDEVSERFGAEVAALVDQVSERKAALGGAPRAWRERKQDTVARLATVSADALALKAADAVDNVRSMVADHAALGPALWDRFNATPDDQLWYYGAIAARVDAGLGGHPLAAELRDAIDKLRALLC